MTGSRITTAKLIAAFVALIATIAVNGGWISGMDHDAAIAVSRHA